MSRQIHTFGGEAPERAHVESLLASGSLLVFEECELSGLDLSRLDLQDCAFLSCVLSETSFYATKLGRTRWQRCRAAHADFESATWSMRPSSPVT